MTTCQDLVYDQPDRGVGGAAGPQPRHSSLNWVTIVAIYIGAFFAVFYKQILFASVPSAATHSYTPSHWVVGIVVAVNFGVLLYEWITIRQYSDSLLAAAGVREKVTAARY